MIINEFMQNKRIIKAHPFKIIHMKISLELLRYLDAIDHHGSFSAAAAALHRVPSAVSHAIAKLEDELELPLFVRDGRSVTLTDAGRALLDGGRHLLAQADALERRVRRIATGWEAELRIAVEMIIPVDRLFPLLESFYAAGHETQVSLSHEVLGGGWDAVASGRSDLAIGVPGDMPPRGGLSSRPLCTSTLPFVIAPHHPLANWPGAVPPEELRRHRAVVIADTARELTPRSMGLLEGQPILRVPDMHAKAAAQLAGLGVGSLPRWLAAPHLASGALVEVPLTVRRPPVPQYVAWRSRDTGRALEWFLEQLESPAVIATLTAGLAAPR